jgi:hypothetical protein
MLSRVAVLACVCIGTCPAVCRADTVSGKELIEKAKVLDGTQVTYRGEAVGEIMPRGDFCWLNLNDGANAVGVWMPKEWVRGVMAGNYRQRGDVLEVSGIFHRSCAQHGGDLDIHAKSIRLLEKGKIIPHQLEPVVLKLSAIFLFALLLLAVRRR